MTFHDTVPTDLGGLGDTGASAAGNLNEPEQALALQFTGSGSEYFRIWVVNLLLSIVTLTLYTPFARARRLTYFYANTRVGGHALGFHGNPWKMLRGHLLVLALSGAYVLASTLSPLVGGVALLVFALVWPALWRASLQFRLANTSWRGLRMGFDGSLAGCYQAMAPFMLPSVLLGLAASLGAGLAVTDGQPPNTWVLALLAVPVLLLPWGLALTKRYQHGGYTFASEAGRLDAGTAAFYLWALKVLGIALLLGAVVLGLFFAGATGGVKGAGVFSVVMVALAMLVYLLFFVLLGPYAVASLQNLVWGRTASRRLRFASHLRAWPYMLLTTKNLLLTALTLGLYRPFAAVAATRMRLQAVSVHARGDLDQWVERATRRSADVTADAAGDFFGIDLGL